MPRSRRRHHSRSRSRSRSHSHDKERDAKRRKIDNVDSPTQKRSVSCEPEEAAADVGGGREEDVAVTVDDTGNTNSNDEANSSISSQDDIATTTSKESADKSFKDKLMITPQKAMSPKQVAKKLESEKKRQQKQLEREERERKRLEEKEEKKKKLEMKEKERLEKMEQKAKEREQREEAKRKEREEKEQKRKEKEERDEQKRKEREQEKLKKQQEIDEKIKEKQKEEEKKLKAAAAFVNFFVLKKPAESKPAEEKTVEVLNSIFMPFEVKSDMRMPLQRRDPITSEERDRLDRMLKTPCEGASYLKDLKSGEKVLGKCLKTWPYEDSSDDVVVLDEDFGESICEDKPKRQWLRSKFLKFHANRRPAFYGTWRKKSARVTGRRPFATDSIYFDYDVDSDDDWEEEEQGESLNGSDDEEKEPEQEVDEYEVDNEFFVPHGHLSDDEVDDEANAKLSPESLKQKLKLLKDEFDQDMQTKTLKIKPRSIGCIWYNKDGSNVEEAIDRHLRPFAMITNGRIIIKKRSEFIIQTPNRKQFKVLKDELIPHFLKMIHGNVNNKKSIIEEFIVYMQNNGYSADVSKANLGRNLRNFAQWRKCPDEGPLLNKFCWYVNDDVKEKFGVDLPQVK